MSSDHPYRDALPTIATAFETADQYATALEAVVDRVRAVHQPSDPDDPLACPFSCTCGWWAYDECPTVRALDGT